MSRPIGDFPIDYTSKSFPTRKEAEAYIKKCPQKTKIIGEKEEWHECNKCLLTFQKETIPIYSEKDNSIIRNDSFPEVTQNRGTFCKESWPQPKSAAESESICLKTIDRDCKGELFRSKRCKWTWGDEYWYRKIKVVHEAKHIVRYRAECMNHTWAYTFRGGRCIPQLDNQGLYCPK